jgi:hypothetical protein
LLLFSFLPTCCSFLSFRFVSILKRLSERIPEESEEASNKRLSERSYVLFGPLLLLLLLLYHEEPSVYDDPAGAFYSERLLHAWGGVGH